MIQDPRHPVLPTVGKTVKWERGSLLLVVVWPLPVSSIFVFPASLLCFRWCSLVDIGLLTQGRYCYLLGIYLKP